MNEILIGGGGVASLWAIVAPKVVDRVVDWFGIPPKRANLLVSTVFSGFLTFGDAVVRGGPIWESLGVFGAAVLVAWNVANSGHEMIYEDNQKKKETERAVDPANGDDRDSSPPVPTVPVPAAPTPAQLETAEREKILAEAFEAADRGLFGKVNR